MDENGNVLHDKMIPITFEYDAQKNAYVCNDKLNIANGIYNIAVFAEGNSMKRFATTSILLKQDKSKPNQQEIKLSVYPNPAKDIVNIEFVTTTTAKYAIELFDIVGKKLMEKQLGNLNIGNQQIQLSTNQLNLPSGSYLISLTQNGERKNSKVFVVN